MYVAERTAASKRLAMKLKDRIQNLVADEMLQRLHMCRDMLKGTLRTSLTAAANL